MNLVYATGHASFPENKCPWCDFRSTGGQCSHLVHYDSLGKINLLNWNLGVMRVWVKTTEGKLKCAHSHWQCMQVLVSCVFTTGSFKNFGPPYCKTLACLHCTWHKNTLFLNIQKTQNAITCLSQLLKTFLVCSNSYRILSWNWRTSNFPRPW